MDPNVKIKTLPKILAISDFQAKEVGKDLFITGYANTKNQADRYGDIPTVFTTLRSFVYDLSQFQRNPVMLLDHRNSIENIVGSYTKSYEDNKGLFIEGKFSNSPSEKVQHSREVFKEGHAKALSIAGRFYFEDKDNPSHLTLAEIFEISLVAVPADPNALAIAMEKALKEISDSNLIDEQKPLSCEDLSSLKDINIFLKSFGLNNQERNILISKIKQYGSLRDAEVPMIKELRDEAVTVKEITNAVILAEEIKRLKRNLN